jgi:phenylacetic acid degradation operon negative regulatory protein
MPVRALISAGELFEIAEGSVRVAVARLLANGAIERDDRGSYRLGAAAAPVDRRVRGWRRGAERMRRWDGGWLAVQRAEGVRGSRREARREKRAHRLFGLAELAPGLWVRPDNLRGGVDAARSELRALGLGDDALVFRLSELSAMEDARARGLWDAPALIAGYRRSRKELERSEIALAELPPESAMVESFRLGGRVIGELVRDPLLPEEIVPAAERRALLETLRRYDRVGRRIWAPFLARFGVHHASAPVDVHAARAAHPLH